MKPLAKSGSSICLTGAIPPPMQGWPIGGVTSAVKVLMSYLGSPATAVNAGIAARAASASRRVSEMGMLASDAGLTFLLGRRDSSFHRAARGSVELFGNAPAQVRQSPGLATVAHGPRHAHGILGAGNRGVEQHAVAAEFHRGRHVAGGADAGVHDHRIVRVAVLEVFEDDADRVGVENALPAANWAAGGHDADRPGRLQS